jgi:hypothetical protein
VEKAEHMCPLYSFCKSPSKSPEWACNKNGDTRSKSCAVYYAFLKGKPEVIEWLGSKGGKDEAK